MLTRRGELFDVLRRSVDAIEELSTQERRFYDPYERRQWRTEPIDDIGAMNDGVCWFHERLLAWINGRWSHEAMRQDCEFFAELSPHWKPGVTATLLLAGSEDFDDIDWVCGSFLHVAQEKYLATPPQDRKPGWHKHHDIGTDIDILHRVRKTAVFAVELGNFIAAIPPGEEPSRKERELFIWGTMGNPHNADLLENYWDARAFGDLRRTALPVYQP